MSQVGIRAGLGEWPWGGAAWALYREKGPGAGRIWRGREEGGRGHKGDNGGSEASSGWGREWVLGGQGEGRYSQAGSHSRREEETHMWRTFCVPGIH